MRTVWIINQYASTLDFGVGGRSYYLAKELAKKGYKVYLIASAANHLLRGKKFVSDSFCFEEVQGINFVWVNVPAYSSAHSKQRVLNWFLFSWRIRKLAKTISDRPETILISSPSPIAFLGAQWLARRFNAKLIFEVRDIWPLTLTEIGGYSPNHPFIRFMQWVEDKAYRESNAVISNLKYSVEHMVSRGMSREKFTWIPNGYCQDETDGATPLEDEVLEQLPKNAFIVGYTGTFGLANDLYTVLDAAAELRDYNDIRFVFVGGGKEKEDLEEYSRKKQLNNVSLINFIHKKQIQTMLARFDVVAVGAKKEPMYRFGVSPNKLFDYLVAGKPIIYHIESGNYHPVNDAECGFEVEAENPRQLADAVLKLYQMSAEDRKILGGNGRKAATEQYEYGKLADQLAEVLFK